LTARLAVPSARSPRQNPYRPGTLSYERQRRGELNRRRALAEARADRAKKPEIRQLAQRQAATARRGLRQIETRAGFRDQLSERHRAEFSALSITQQDRFRAAVQRYPEYVPPSDPDPFEERRSYRGSLWRLYYSTRAGIRRRAAA
jgi:hypothetical protein